MSWTGGSITVAGGDGATGSTGGAGGAACSGSGLTGFSGGAGAAGAPTPTVEGGGGGGSAGSAANGLPGVGLVGGIAVADGGKGGNEEAAGGAPGGGGGGSRVGIGFDGGAGQVKLSFVSPPVASPTAVPTLGQWSVLALSGTLAIARLGRSGPPQTPVRSGQEAVGRAAAAPPHKGTGFGCLASSMWRSPRS